MVDLRRAALAGAMVFAAIATFPAAAQVAWPTRPVKFIVPFPPGGSTDPMARMIAAKLSDSLGQQFVVEKRQRFLQGRGKELLGPPGASDRKFTVSCN